MLELPWAPSHRQMQTIQGPTSNPSEQKEMDGEISSPQSQSQRQWLAGAPYKFRRPESGENNQRAIGKKPYTFSWDTKRWVPDAPAIPTELKAANLAAPSTPLSSAGSIQSDPDRSTKQAMFVGSSGASLQSDPGSRHAMIAIHARMIEKVQGNLAKLVTLQDSFIVQILQHIYTKAYRFFFGRSCR